MIFECLSRQFASDKNRVKCMRFLSAMVFAVWLAGMGFYALERKSLLLTAAGIFAAAVWGKLFLVPGENAGNAAQRCRDLKDRNYSVREVIVSDMSGSPLDIGGLSAVVCADGDVCTDKILLRTDMAKTVRKNQGRALLMKMPDGLYFRLFAYAQDWERRKAEH